MSGHPFCLELLKCFAPYGYRRILAEDGLCEMFSRMDMGIVKKIVDVVLAGISAFVVDVFDQKDSDASFGKIPRTNLLL